MNLGHATRASSWRHAASDCSAADSRALQVWRLSDLTLLATLDLPEARGAAAEPRMLLDGKTVLVSTFGCKLLRIDVLKTDSPSVALAYDFGGENCAVPVVAEDLWIQTVPGVHGLVALDVSNPEQLREVSRLVLGDEEWPHWISLEPGGRRIVVTGYAGTRHRILMIDLDGVTKQISVDSAFTSPGARAPRVLFDRADWPHGVTGPADRHEVVFLRSASPPAALPNKR